MTWAVFNGGGAVEAEGAHAERVRDLLTPERLSRGWTAACFAGSRVVGVIRTEEDLRAAFPTFNDNLPMPQSTKERQEALRARRAMLGMTEVRGIYLPLDMHAELKAHARKLAKRAAAGVVARKPPEDERS